MSSEKSLKLYENIKILTVTLASFIERDPRMLRSLTLKKTFARFFENLGNLHLYALVTLLK